jgi:Domain of unknown function (DUF4157)
MSAATHAGKSRTDTFDKGPARAFRSPSVAAATSRHGAPLASLQQAAGNAAVDELLGGGASEPLPSALRRDMELRFGHDFGAVRVLTGPRAADATGALGAKAFTHGEDIVFAPGRFAPDTLDGKRLLGHELAHVVQQSRGGAARPTLDGRGPLEAEAAQAGEAASNRAGAIAVASSSAVGPAADPETAQEDVPWYRRAAQGLSDAASAAKRVYDDPKAALAEAKTEATDVYDKYAGKAAAVVDEARAAWDKTDLKKDLMQGVEDKTVQERVSDWVDKQQPEAGDSSPKAELLRSAGAMLKASARLSSTPMRAAERALLNGHPIQAVEDYQKEADEGLKDVKAATFSTINKWEDGKFEPQREVLIDPAAHPTLAKVEQGLDAAGDWVGKRQRQVSGGAAKALYSMVEGVGNLALHPANAAQGLGKIAEMGSPLPSQDTLKEGVGFAQDLFDPKISAGKALERLYEAEKKKQEGRAEQGMEMLKGFGHNYVEAAGGEFVPPESEQTAEQKTRFAGKKLGEISWAGWKDRERIGEIPGLLAVDVGSFFVGGGEANAAAKTARLTEAAGTVRALEAGGELARTAPRVAELASKSEIPADLAKAAETRPLAPPPGLPEPVPIEPLKPPELPEPPKPLEAAEPPKPAEPAKVAKPPDAVERAKPPEPGEINVPAGPADPLTARIESEASAEQGNLLEAVYRDAERQFYRQRYANQPELLKRVEAAAEQARTTGKVPADLSEVDRVALYRKLAEDPAGMTKRFTDVEVTRQAGIGTPGSPSRNVDVTTRFSDNPVKPYQIRPAEVRWGRSYEKIQADLDRVGQSGQPLGQGSFLRNAPRRGADPLVQGSRAAEIRLVEGHRLPGGIVRREVEKAMIDLGSQEFSTWDALRQPAGAAAPAPAGKALRAPTGTSFPERVAGTGDLNIAAGEGSGRVAQYDRGVRKAKGITAKELAENRARRFYGIAEQMRTLNRVGEGELAAGSRAGADLAPVRSGFREFMQNFYDLQENTGKGGNFEAFQNFKGSREALVNALVEMMQKRTR